MGSPRSSNHLRKPLVCESAARRDSVGAVAIRHPILWLPIFALAFACDREGHGATSGAAPSAAPTAAPTVTSAVELDDEIETVDDTIPPSSTEDEGDDADPGDPEEGCAPKQEGLKPLQVLLFRWTSGIEDKDPKDRLHVARPGQRVYAHLRMRNRSGTKRCLKLVFRVGDEKRTEVTLRIGESWNWRTWAYNTVKRDDRKPLHLTIHDDQGALVLDERLPVVPE